MASLHKVRAANSTNATLVKASPTKLHSIFLHAGAVETYLKLYDKATAPVPGTDVPIAVIPVHANGAVNLIQLGNVVFKLGLGYAITLNSADNDATVVAANAVIGHLLIG